jgi:hypothetical protein
VSRLAVRHLLAETELAKAIATPAENFGKLFRGYVIVILKADFVHAWLTLLAQRGEFIVFRLLSCTVLFCAQAVFVIDPILSLLSYFLIGELLVRMTRRSLRVVSNRRGLAGLLKVRCVVSFVHI